MNGGASQEMLVEFEFPDENEPGRELPTKPVIAIDGGRRWSGLELADLWAHRDLFYFLAWRDVKVRYKQTLLGAAWAILQPLLTMVVFTLLFGKLAHIPSEGEPYAIFSYAGLLPWNFFTAAVTNSSNSLVTSTNLITKVYFPRLLVPSAAVGAALVDIAIASLMLFVIMPIYGVGFHPSLILFVPLVVLTALDCSRSRDLDVGAERKVPRHPLCSAVRYTDFDVFDAGHLSGELPSRALAMGARTQSPKRHYRRFSRRNFQPSHQLERTADFNPHNFRAAGSRRLHLPPDGRRIR